VIVNLIHVLRVTLGKAKSGTLVDVASRNTAPIIFHKEPSQAFVPERANQTIV
jgi:hypothetical protein